MNIEYRIPSRHAKSVSAKAAYSEAARRKLVEYKGKFDGVRAAIRRETANGRLKSSDKLECAERAVDLRLAMAEGRLKMLQKSGADEWEQLRHELDDAWEDLSYTINKLVARIKHESGQH